MGSNRPKYIENLQQKRKMLARHNAQFHKHIGATKSALQQQNKRKILTALRAKCIVRRVKAEHLKYRKETVFYVQ